MVIKGLFMVWGQFFICIFFILWARNANAQIDFLGVEDGIVDIQEDNINASDEITVNNESANNSPDESLNYLDDYIDDVETEKQAKSTARDILKSKPEILKLRENQVKSLKESILQREALRKKAEEIEHEKMSQEEIKAKKVSEIKNKLEPAPLGLYWGASLEELQFLGFELIAGERENYQNVYVVKNIKQKNNTFAKISVIFGEQDKLWCIFAEGNYLDDNNKAEKVTYLYKQYYNALEKKYGNAKEFFSPYTYEEEIIEIVKDEKGEKEVVNKITKSNPMGGDSFAQELFEQKASLYSTFTDNKLGITLGVNVSKGMKSSISIDYKNLKLMNIEKKEKAENLIEDI